MTNENPILEALTKPASDGTTPGATPNPPDADIRTAISGASAEAVREHNADAATPKRKRGRPRIIPVAGLDDSPGEISGGAPLPENPVAGLDEATAKALAESVLSGIEHVVGSIQYNTAMQCYDGDTVRADAAQDKAKFPPDLLKKLTDSGAVLVKIYMQNMKYAPHTAFGIPFGLYCLGQLQNNRGMRAERRARLKAQGINPDQK